MQTENTHLYAIALKWRIGNDHVSETEVRKEEAGVKGPGNT